MSRPERRRGLGAAGLGELRRLLSERDLAVLEVVGKHRFLTSRHVELFCFGDHATASSGARTCRRVLARLGSHGLLDRPIRRVGGLQAGSASSIWMLSSAGRRLLNLQAGVGAVGRVREPGERFIAHYLAIADAHLALIQAQQHAELELVTVQIEPACWRSYTGLGGGQQILKPDLYAVTASGEFEDHWFCEIDRGTESLPTLLKQCQQYETYRRSGTEQHVAGVFPRVVWVVPDEIRASKLRTALSAAHGFDRELFKVTTPVAFVTLVAGGAA
jgi:hypothetical protein